MDAIWETGNPKLAIPCPEALADSSRQNRARHSAPQSVSGMLVDILYVPHSDPSTLLGDRASIQ